jgi:hypothetical protein
MQKKASALLAVDPETSRYSRVNTKAGGSSLVSSRLFQVFLPKGQRGRIHSGRWIMDAPKS